jgi:DNA adenine methylase
MFQKVQFYSQSYEITLRSIEPGALVYLDPPYLPIKASSFVSYTDKGFSTKEHANFFQLVMKLHLRKIFFVMSNSFNDQIIKLFQEFVIRSVVCKRKITPKKPSASCEELLISNANKISDGNETSGGSPTTILSLMS